MPRIRSFFARVVRSRGGTIGLPRAPPPGSRLGPRREKPDDRHEVPGRSRVRTGHERARIKRVDAAVVRLIVASRSKRGAVDHDSLIDEDALVNGDVEVATSLTSERRSNRSAVVAGEGPRQRVRVVATWVSHRWSGKQQKSARDQTNDESAPEHGHRNPLCRIRERSSRDVRRASRRGTGRNVRVGFDGTGLGGGRARTPWWASVRECPPSSGVSKRVAQPRQGEGEECGDGSARE